jgi:hypothetical protein
MSDMAMFHQLSPDARLLLIKRALPSSTSCLESVLI